MRTSVLGGEGGRRGFFGGRASRARVIGLCLVAVAGGTATVLFQTLGLVLAVIAAVVVYLATARTHRGSILVRWQDRRRWRERVTLGVDAFRPVTTRPAELDELVTGRPEASSNGHVRRAPAPRKATREDWRQWRAYRDWPDGAEGMFWLQSGIAEPGIVWHLPTGEQNYLSVAFEVEGQVRGVESDQFLDAAMMSFGQLLARYGSASSLVSRVQSLTRVLPVDSALHEDWVWHLLDPNADPELLASYDEVIRLVSRSGLMQRHYMVLRWPLTSEFLAAAERRGPAQEGWKALMASEIDVAASHLRTAKLGRVTPLSAKRLTAVLRHMQIPSWPIEQARDADPRNPWAPSHDEWSATVTEGYGPLPPKRDDDSQPPAEWQQWWHRTALLPIDAFETGPRSSLWVAPLLSQMPYPIVRTLSLQTEMVPASDARSAARIDVTSDLADLEAERHKGMLTSEELEVALRAAKGRLEDLRPGSGHHGAGWAGHLTISASSRQQLIDATTKITEAAANAGIASLQWLDTQQAAAMACTWPLARGMREVDRGMAANLRSVLAGIGVGKEGL